MNMEKISMNKTKKQKSSAVIPVLVGVIVILVAVIGIMGFYAIKQINQKTPDAEKVQVSAVPGEEKTSGYPAHYQIQFEQEWLVNKDFKGYLTLEGTALSTNVVQGTDNTFYRDHGFDGGTDSRIAFLDYRADIETPSTQLMIYLPHVDNHEKYGELVNFKSLEYYKEHPIISFNSLLRNAKYKIFAVALFPSGYEGIPFQTCMETNDKSQLITLVQKALDHSILDIPVDVRDTDELLTVMSEDLSLMDENGKYARIVVFARKIRDGESEAVNTQNAVTKPNKYMPQSWYDQILREQYVSAVNQEIREEAAGWFTAFELSNIADADLERLLTARKAEYQKYLTEQELLLSAEEKAYLYEKRVNDVKVPVMMLNFQNLTTRVGDVTALKAQLDIQDPAATYTWSSSNKDVISVEGNGTGAKLTALKAGTATITVTSGKATASCEVDVQPAKSFVLNPSSITVFVDNSYNIEASSDILQATSGSTGIAKVSVSQNRVTVMGVSPGVTTVTVTGENGMTATCKVTVKRYQISLDKTSLTMQRGNRREIHVSTGEAANWYVSNTNVVRLTEIEKGKVVLVEAIGPGTATVIATARNGAQESCQITVDGSGVSFSTNSMDLYKGEFREMTVISGNVTKWEISDKSVAQVCIFSDGKTIEVEALGYGTAVIKAYGADGSFATMTVNVSAPKESLTITPYSLTVTKGEMRNITVTGGSASNWVSSNPSVAEVYVVGDGTFAQVEGRNPGTATITVYDRYGGWVNCNVTVEERVPKLTIGPATVCIDEGDWEDVVVLSGEAVAWTSSNENIVGIYSVGGATNSVRIKGNSAGTAQVIAHSADGSTAVCTVTVEAPVVTQQLILDKYSMSISVGEVGLVRISDGYFGEWISNNPAVAEVCPLANGNIGEIEGLAPGTAIITAYWPDGTTASCTVTVEAAYVPPEVAEEPLTLNTQSVTVEEGDWAEIFVTGGRCVDWNTTNQNIVRIYTGDNPNHLRIKGESAGTAEIIAYAPDGTTTVCKVTVTAYEEPIEIVDSDPLFFEEPVYVQETEPVYVSDSELKPEPESESETVPESESFENFGEDDSDAG